MEPPDAEVLVVGAGPAGLAAAAMLGRYEIPTLVVEQRLGPPSLPRATVISTRVMEHLRSWGLEGEVRAGGVEGDAWMWECDTLADAASGRAIAAGYPTREQAALVSPTSPAIVPQDWLETVLRSHLGSLESVDVELGAEVVAIDGDVDGAIVMVRDRAGRAREVRARFVIGADGAASAVRRLAGIEMGPAEGDDLGGVQVVFRARLWPIVGERRYVLYSVTTPTAPGVFLPAGRHDRWVYGPASDDVDPASVVDLIRAGAGADVDVSIERIGAFRSAGQLARRFRAGNVFLAGDAAHRVTPRGGTGMNLAFAGGYDLGWKIAWVAKGWAEPALLDTYERERRLVAEHNVARSTDPDGSRRSVVSELAVDLGGRIAHAWLPSSGGRTSTLDLVGAGWTAFATPRMQSCGSRWSGTAPLTVRVVDDMTARALGVRDGSLLVRPDGIPASLVSRTVSQHCCQPR